MNATDTLMSLDDAFAIMGKNYIGPGEILHEIYIDLKKAPLNKIALISYSAEILEMKRKDFILIPVFPMSIKEMFEQKRSLFWYCDDNEIFNLGEKVYEPKTKFGWLLIRKNAVPYSMKKPFAEQITLLGEEESVPDVQTLAYANMIYFMLRSESIISEGIDLRTSSFTQREGEKGSRISVSNDLDGIQFKFHDEDAAEFDLGLASQVKI